MRFFDAASRQWLDYGHLLAISGIFPKPAGFGFWISSPKIRVFLCKTPPILHLLRRYCGRRSIRKSLIFSSFTPSTTTILLLLHNNIYIHDTPAHSCTWVCGHIMCLLGCLCFRKNRKIAKSRHNSLWGRGLLYCIHSKIRANTAANCGLSRGRTRLRMGSHARSCVSDRAQAHTRSRTRTHGLTRWLTRAQACTRRKRR